MTDLSWNGKGSNRRPLAVTQEENDIRWELAFCQDDSQKKLLLERLEELEETYSVGV